MQYPIVIVNGVTGSTGRRQRVNGEHPAWMPGVVRRALSVSSGKCDWHGLVLLPTPQK